MVLTALGGHCLGLARAQEPQPARDPGLLPPTVVRGQDYEPPDPVFPVPLYHNHPENGGFYAAGSFVFFRQTNPLGNQPVAVRGVNDTFGNIQATMNFLTDIEFNNPGAPVQVGKFFGTGTEALNVHQVSGPNSYQPGFRISLGWKFQNDLDVEFNWTHLVNKKESATAAPIGPTLNGGPDNFDSFLFSPVYNFPNNYAGVNSKLTLSLNTPGSFTVGPIPLGFLADQVFHTTNGPYGIWNGAQLEQIQFFQRYDDFELIGRIPMYESERCRCYGLFGPRAVQLWENFQWRTIDYSVLNVHLDVTPTGVRQIFDVAADSGGISGPQFQALYSNTVSNRLYGPLFGYGTDVYIGHGFGVNFEIRGAPMIDVVKERAKYELGDRSTSAQRNRTDYDMAYELDGRVNLTWYPIEGVELRVGYEVMNFFNTVSSPQPIDFNMGSLTPKWDRGTYRFFDGFTAGISLIF
jgi:hypothetical protein